MKKKITLLTITVTLFGLIVKTNAQTVTDINGNIYNTVTIGAQVWMKENLKVTKYRNGDSIGTTTGSIPNDSTSKYQCAYNDDNNNIATYGRLYTWYAVTDSRNVCPVDWRVPTDAEWCILENFVEINTDPTCNSTGGRGINTGGKLKEDGTAHWLSPNLGADNSSGFTALPGAYRKNDGTFNYINYYGNWWSATEYDASNAWGRALHYDAPDVYRYNFYLKSLGFSVRCVRDSVATGLNESINNQFFKLFPNPNDGKFNIIIPNIATGKIIIEIYSLLGEKVLQQEKSNEIDLSKSPKGIYFVKIYDGKKMYTEKIVIQ